MLTLRQRLLELAAIDPSTILFVFDLDSTLFNTRYRTQKIFEEWSHESSSVKQHPILAEKIQRWVAQSAGSWVKEIYDPVDFVAYHTREPIISRSPLAVRLRYFWSQRFFHGSYLRWDRPYPGVCSLLAELVRMGCAVSYLTARSRRPLLGGTLLSLSQHQLPLPGVDEVSVVSKQSRPQVALILKECDTVDDQTYKDRALEVFKSHPWFSRLVFVENEPAIVNMADQNHPSIHTYLYRSVHSATMSWDDLSAKLQSQSFSSWL